MFGTLTARDITCCMCLDTKFSGQSVKEIHDSFYVCCIQFGSDVKLGMKTLFTSSGDSQNVFSLTCMLSLLHCWIAMSLKGS